MSTTERQKQKKLEKKKQKRKDKPSNNSVGQPTSGVTADAVLQKLQDFSQKVSTFATTINKEFNGSISLLLETMYRQGILTETDIEATKQARQAREVRRQEKIKEMLESELDTEEKLQEISRLENEDIPVYDKLIINPVKELNLDPYEVFEILKDEDKTLQEMANLGTKWAIHKETLEKILIGIQKEMRRDAVAADADDDKPVSGTKPEEPTEKEEGEPAE